VNRTLVADVMTTPVVTATEAMPFRDLVALLYARDIGAVPVVAAGGQLLDVVSRSDLIAKAAGRPAPGLRLKPGSRRRVRARTAAELMTAPAITVAPEMIIELAARIMRDNKVGRLPVRIPLTGRLAGIVTRSDLLRVYLRPGEEIRAEILAEACPRVRGADPRRLTIAVRDGVVSISGRVERRSAIAGLVKAVLAVEGVVGVDNQLAFDLDDGYPITPASF
jgi:CBS-domain-containing membrane protein